MRNALPSSTASGLGSASLIFENKQLANSNWQLAKHNCDPLPTRDWDWDWVSQGSRKGDPSVTQGPRKRLPRVDSENFLCLQQKLKNAGWGSKRSGDLVIARDQVIVSHRFSYILVDRVTL